MTLESLKNIIEKCVRCGKCRARCPSLEANEDGTPGWEIYGPRGRMRLASGILEDEIPITDMVQDGIYTCFFCNQCVVSCPSMANITDVIIETRKYLVEKGLVAKSVLQAQETINDSKNLFGMDQEDRVELWSMDVDELIEDRINIPADVLFFIGCQGSFRGELVDIPVRMVQIFDKIGEEFTLLGEDELCCGNPLELTGGSNEQLKALAEYNIEKIESLGVKRVIFSCPGCYRTFKKTYPKLLGKDLPFICQMASEYLLEKINDGSIKLQEISGIGKVVYHDPCELGRHMNYYEIPQELIKKIPSLDFIEFKDNKENCNCCGMGGGVALHDEKVADFQARNKSKDIEEIEANIVVTHCPACFQGIGKAIEKIVGEAKNIKVMDIIELIALSMGIED